MISHNHVQEKLSNIFTSTPISDSFHSVFIKESLEGTSHACYLGRYCNSVLIINLGV